MHPLMGLLIPSPAGGDEVQMRVVLTGPGRIKCGSSQLLVKTEQAPLETVIVLSEVNK